MVGQRPHFCVRFGNIPLINLRWEFKAHHRVAHTAHFMTEPDGRVRSIETPYVVWHGMPTAGATMLVQRAISAIEAYVCAAAQSEAVRRGTLTPELKRGLKNPFSLGRGGAAHNYYNRLPGMVHHDLAMQVANPGLWTTTKAFYEEVRNPIMHGREFTTDVTEDDIAALFDHLAGMYRWIDSWFDAEQLMKGAARSFEV